MKYKYKSLYQEILDAQATEAGKYRVENLLVESPFRIKDDCTEYINYVPIYLIFKYKGEEYVIGSDRNTEIEVDTLKKLITNNNLPPKRLYVCSIRSC